MSLVTWKEEFYPVDASEACQSVVEALKHAVHKWRGALPENLERHHVRLSGSNLREKGASAAESLFGATGCSLCLYDGNYRKNCTSCALRNHLGCRCYGSAASPDQADNNSVYLQAINDGNVRPMINALEQTLDHELNRAG